MTNEKKGPGKQSLEHFKGPGKVAPEAPMSRRPLSTDTAEIPAMAIATRQQQAESVKELQLKLQKIEQAALANAELKDDEIKALTEENSALAAQLSASKAETQKLRDLIDGLKTVLAETRKGGYVAETDEEKEAQAAAVEKYLKSLDL